MRSRPPAGTRAHSEMVPLFTLRKLFRDRRALAPRADPVYRETIYSMGRAGVDQSREYIALAELRYQIRRFLNFSEAEARVAKVEPQQHQLLLVLAALRPSQKPTIRTVAERLQIQHHSAVELVKRSVERNLVERRTAVHDRREASLRVTARGKRVLRRLSVAHRRELRLVAPVLLRALASLVHRRAPPARAASAIAAGDGSHFDGGALVGRRSTARGIRKA